MAKTRRGFSAGIMFVGCVAGMMSIGDRAWAVNTWERWEGPLTSSQPRTPLQAYRDVQIEATFWRKSGSTCTEPATCTNPDSCFKGLAFWDGDVANPGRFMIRSAFPAGTWCWKTCLLPRNGSVCTVDSGLNKSGEIPVTTPPGARSPLYSNGFPKAPAAKRNLTYWNGQTPFQWLGDTAWNAPIYYASNRTLWKNYVTKRAVNYVGNTFAGGDGFTNVLVAPAVQTLANPPAGGFRGFIAPPGCGTGDRPVVPANCHYWDSAYWRDFEAMIKVANDAGILIVIADVMDPLNRAGSNQGINPQVLFPRRADAAIFARNLAARLAGSFVAYSPSFDSRANDSTAEPGVNVAGLIDAVGTAIRSATSRHLIGVHLAGGSALSDYDQFQGKPWLNLQVFQSGSGTASCGSLALSNDFAKWVCRARSFALRFRCIGEPASNATCTGSGAPTGQPVKPAVNIEGQYEVLGNTETRVQGRHIGWNSGLSGSFGYNIGVWTDIAAWTNPSAYAASNHQADDDLGRLKGLFKSMPWSELKPRHDLLVEQNNFSGTQCNNATQGIFPKADWLQLWKPHFAIDANSTYALAYLPRPTPCTPCPAPPASCTLPNGTPNGTPYLPSTSIVIERAKANALGISCATWTGQWVSPGSTAHPDGFVSTGAACLDTANGPVKFMVRPNTVECIERCDRVLKLTRNTSGFQNSPNIVASYSIDLQTDVQISDDGQTSTIIGQISRNGWVRGEPIPLSGPDQLFRKLPSAALDAEGNFLVVWEEENSAGTDDIFAARFNSLVEPLGSPFLINDTTDGQQAEPWISGDDSGDTVAVWTSYSEDEELAGDIYGKVLDSSGQPIGPEFLVSIDSQGNQFMPQVQMVGDGSFVVAWTEEPSGDPTGELTAASAETAKIAGRRKEGGVYYRVFGYGGRSRGPERRVDSGSQRQARLSRLEVHRDGGFKIRWHEVDAAGHDQGEREQEHDRDGDPKGEH